MALWTFNPNTTCDVWIGPNTPSTGVPDYVDVPIQQLRSFVDIPNYLASSGARQPNFFYRLVLDANPEQLQGAGEAGGFYARLAIPSGSADGKFYYRVYSTSQQWDGTTLHAQFLNCLRDANGT